MSGSVWGGVSYSDMIYFTNPSGAGVIDTGNNVWIGDLRACTLGSSACAAPTITKITNNILRVFGQGPAGRLEPVVANASAISPAGS